MQKFTFILIVTEKNVTYYDGSEDVHIDDWRI